MELGKYFENRQYPENVIKSAFQKVSTLTQEETLVTSNVENKQKNIVPFVIEYNSSLPNLGLTINKYWDLFNLSNKESLNFLHKHKPVVAYKRTRNLQDYLTHSTLNIQKERSESTKCHRRRCTHCKSIIESTNFTSTNTCETFELRCSGTCASNDVIYLITCKKCKMQYVGQTHQLLSMRMNSHKFNIRNMEDPSFSTNVAIHFNSNEHSMDDFTFMPIDQVSDNMQRLLKETYWIHKLDTLYPKGLNAKVLYKF
ncbi:MAG: GIY-YIG nuclease family protein [Candidatus Thiodiazotropha taylori]|nr:GIY-YIG nuclease family protein [Candidatus Thiodiazotropha taylori]MCW4311368.1 GIY-YIG nuclease family protein [Candidatus Thiodiazotropha endolucinida]